MYKKVQGTRKIKKKPNKKEEQKTKQKRKPLTAVKVSHKQYRKTCNSHVSRSRALNTAERNTKATNRDTTTGTIQEKPNKIQRLDRNVLYIKV